MGISAFQELQDDHPFVCPHCGPTSKLVGQVEGTFFVLDIGYGIEVETHLPEIDENTEVKCSLCGHADTWEHFKRK